jgi:hypothetical protein
LAFFVFYKIFCFKEVFWSDFLIDSIEWVKSDILETCNNLRLKALPFAGILISFCLWVLTVSPLYGQRTSVTMNGQLIEHYNVFRGDTALKHGDYELYYKTHLIEKGSYNRGKKTGVWTYLNLGNAFEFQYDFDRDSLIKISGERQYRLRYESPCLYLGSPLVPYAFLTTIVGYPPDALEGQIAGKVDLILNISKTGEILNRHAEEDGSNKLLSEAVLKGSYDFPDDWRWIPARENNQRIESTYKITIHFELH